MQKPPVPVTFAWNLGGQHVVVSGSFNNWKTELALQRNADGEWKLVHSLEPGIHQYKFVVDGVWRHHPDQPTVHDEVGNINNFIDVGERTARELFPKPPPSPPESYAQNIPAELTAAANAAAAASAS